MAEKKWCVYMHTNKINGKKYIGITSLNTKIRWGLKGQGYKTQYFKRAIDKYGWDNFEHEILFNDLEEKIAKEKEIELIAKYKAKDKNFGYNLTDGGDETVGVILSDKARENMRIAHIGQVAWNKGIKGIYTSEKTRDIRRQQWKNEDYRNKQTISHMGNKQSEETKKKISKNNRNSKIIYQIDINGNIIKEWNSYAEICREFVNSKGNHRKRFSKENIFYDGYVWIQKEKYTKEEVFLIIDKIKNGINVNKITRCKNSNKNKNKIIEKYDKNMCLLQTYKSLSSASFENNIDKNTIKKYYKNGKIYGDVYFRVKE